MWPKSSLLPSTPMLIIHPYAGPTPPPYILMQNDGARKMREGTYLHMMFRIVRRRNNGR